MTTSAGTRGTDDDVSVIAYEIWESEGRPDGRDKEHWFLAKKRVADGDDESDASGVKVDPNGSATARPVQPGFDDAAGDDPKDEAVRQIGQGEDHTHVRPAGRKKMDLPPSTWSKTDEELDKSFPASDPPGNY